MGPGKQSTTPPRRRWARLDSCEPDGRLSEYGFSHLQGSTLIAARLRRSRMSVLSPAGSDGPGAEDSGQQCPRCGWIRLPRIAGWAGYWTRVRLPHGMEVRV